MTINFIQIWDMTVKVCAVWIPFITLISASIVIGQDGKPITKKFEDTKGVPSLLFLITIPSIVVLGRIFSWW